MKSLTTDRLLLRGWRDADIADLAAMMTDPDAMRFSSAGPRDPSTALEEAKNSISAWQEDDQGYWAIEGRDDGAFHGWVGLFPLEDGPEIEIGYRLLPASWGKGIATEAARRLLAYGFEAQGLDLIVAVTHPDNKASQWVLEKCGLNFHDTRMAYGFPGCHYFRLTKSAWLKRAEGSQGAG